MKNYSLLFLLLSVLFSHQLMAKKFIATVSKIRGVVTVLPPGAIHARKLLKGDDLYEDSSILTTPHSFVQVRYTDGSTLNLGPKSKIVLVELKKRTGVGVVSLLKGKLRASIQKREQSKRTGKNKFFVKTRSAALGVRGTVFQTTYNPSNDATALLTFEGKVAMAKVDEHIIEKHVKEVATDEEKQVQHEKVEKTKKDWNNNKVTSETMDKLLESKDIVVVKQGQYSGVTEGLKKSSLPVKISPKQFTVLYHSNEFQKVDKKDTKKLVKQAKQEAPLEGVYDKKTGDFAPRSGGFIDQNTGLYIPPSKNSKLDTKLGVYEAKDIGKLSLAGNYVAPKGLKLDAKQGFVIDKKYIAKEGVVDKSKLLVMKESLNNTIETDIVLKKKAERSSVYALTFPELFQKNTFTYSLRPNDSRIKVVNISNEGLGERELNDKDRVQHKFSWSHVSDGHWQLVTSFTIKNNNQDNYYIYDNYSASTKSDTLYGLGLTFNYLFSSTSLIKLDFDIDQDLYAGYYYSTTDTMYYMELEKVALLKFMVSYEKRFFHYKRFFMDALFGIGASKPKEQGHFDLRVQLLTKVNIGFNYWLGRSYSLRFGVWSSHQSGDVKGSIIPAEIKQSNNGADIRIGYIF